MANEMSYPLGSAVAGGAGLSEDYARTVATFNDIYNKRREAPFDILQKASVADYQSQQANAVRILTPLKAQELLNKSKMDDLEIASANMQLQEQYKTIKQKDEWLQGQAEFSNSSNSFYDDNGNVDIQTISTATPPGHLSPFGKQAWIQERDKVIGQLGAQTLQQKALMIQAKQAKYEIDLQDWLVENRLEDTPENRRAGNAELAALAKATREKELALASNPNVVPNSKGGYTAIGGTKGSSGGFGIPNQMAIKLGDADGAFLQGVDAFIDDPTNNGRALAAKLAPLGKYGVGRNVILARQEAMAEVNKLRPKLQDASDEILKAEKAANPFIGKPTQQELQAVKVAHAKYDSIHDEMQRYRDVLKQPILSSLGSGAVVNPAIVPSGQKLVPMPTNTNAEKLIKIAARLVEQGHDINVLKQNLRLRGVDPSPLDVLGNISPGTPVQEAPSGIGESSQTTKPKQEQQAKQTEEKPFMQTSEERRAEEAAKRDAERAEREKVENAQSEQEKRQREEGYKEAEFHRVAEALNRLENPSKYEKGEGTQVGITESKDADIKTIRAYQKKPNADPKLLARIKTLQP